MAIRAPVAYTKYIDQEALRTGKPILAAEFDAVLNDQSFFLNSEGIVISDCFWRHGSVSSAYETVAIYHMDTIDKCDAAGLTRAQNFAVYCKCDAATTGRFKLTTNLGGVTVAISHNTWDWFGVSAVAVKTINAEGNGVEETFELEVQRLTGVGKVWIGGLFCTTAET